MVIWCSVGPVTVVSETRRSSLGHRSNEGILLGSWATPYARRSSCRLGCGTASSPMRTAARSCRVVPSRAEHKRVAMHPAVAKRARTDLLHRPGKPGRSSLSGTRDGSTECDEPTLDRLVVALLRSDLLLRAGMQDVAVGKDSERRRRRPTGVDRIRGLVCDADVARPRIGKRDYATDTSGSELVEAAREEPRLRVRRCPTTGRRLLGLDTPLEEEASELERLRDRLGIGEEAAEDGVETGTEKTATATRGPALPSSTKSPKRRTPLGSCARSGG